MFEKKHIKNIAVIRTDRIGEVLLSSSVVDVLHENFPESRIIFVTSLIAKEVVEYKQSVDKVLVFETMDRKVGYLQALRWAKVLR